MGEREPRVCEFVKTISTASTHVFDEAFERKIIKTRHAIGAAECSIFRGSGGALATGMESRGGWI
jgi:hypothetical protein